jgi:hypothetical protein
MTTWRSRFSDEEVDEISESSGSESEAETDSTYCSSDTDSDFDETSSQSTSRSTHDEPWRIGNFRPNKLTFMSTNSGCTSIVIQKLKGDTPIDFFNLFFDENLMGTIVDQTNLYYYQTGKASSKAAKTPSWSDTTIDEMYVFLATTMLMSFTKKNKLLSYWSTDRLIMTPIFNELFPRHRYFAILQYLHFNNNTEQPDDDRLYKVNPVLHHLKEKFLNSFYPYQNICIDEGMIAFKDRLKFKQYIPLKRNRFGIKLFLICDCSTGFILNFIVYTGSTTERFQTSELDIPGSIVMLLLENYLDKDHIIYVDNWYSSPKLFRVLYERSTGACGTIRKNRSGFPVFQEELQQGEQSVLHTANMLALKWHDKRDVYMLSTVHDSSMVSTGKKNSLTGEEILKPLCVKEYNQNKGAVDKSCMQMTFSESLRKSVNGTRNSFSI